MESTKTNFYESLEKIFKAATPIGAIVAFGIGIYHYRDSQAEDFKRVYWEKRYDVYKEICLISSEAANVTSASELDSARKEFWTAFTGKSMLVEDLHVYDALTSFGSSLNSASYPDSLRLLVTKAHAISRACRTSLKETWEPVPVGEIKALEN